MIVSKLVLKNWRNFKSVDIDLTDRVFIIGPNASGKSNLLDAIRFLRDIAKPGGGLQTALTQRGGLSKVRCLAARRDPDVEIEVQLSENGGPAIWTYALGITQQVRGYRQPVLRFERVLDNEKKLILDRPDSNDKKDELRLTQTHLEQISSNSGFRDIARLFESVRYLHLVPQLLRNPEALQAAARVEDPYGRSFLETVAKTTEKTRKSRLKKIESALRAAVPQLKQLTDVKDEAGVPHLEALWEHWRPNAGLQREDQFSDGTLRLIGLFWSLLDGDAPLLLEEPELSLNSAIVSKLPEMFYRMQRKRKRQLFVSTHSWEILSDQGIAGQEVVLLKPTQEGSEATIASSIDEVRQQLEAGLSVADAVLPRTTPRDLNGYLKKTIQGWNRAARSQPFLVLTDLDEFECPVQLIRTWLAEAKHPNLLFRVGVREVESWLLADAEGFASFLRIPPRLIPPSPDLLPDAKKTLVDLARKARASKENRTLFPNREAPQDKVPATTRVSARSSRSS